MPSPSAGYSALKRFGEMLMRQSENDPRLARAAAQGYDLLNPVVHGTNSLKITSEAPRGFYAASQPEHALNYTGGNRRAGIGAQSKGGMLVPLVLKGKPLNTGLAVDTPVSYTDFEWLRALGIDDPEAFRQKVWERNTQRQLAMPNTQKYLAMGRTFDNAFGDSMGVPDRVEYPRKLHEALDAIAAELAEVQPLISFKHPYIPAEINAKGRVLRAKGTVDDDSILVADPSLARSPWAAFEEEGLGLMKKRGGLIQYKESCK